jgi:hypothetical protein
MIKEPLLYRTRSAHIVAAIPSYYQSSYKDNFRQIHKPRPDQNVQISCAISNQIAQMYPPTPATGHPRQGTGDRRVYWFR